MALPVNIKDLLHDRDHRNRRIGDFLKELELTEGRGTGFPTIYRVMERNGSAEPVFETDDQSTHFLTILPARVEKSNPAGNQAGNLVQESINKAVYTKVIPLLKKGRVSGFCTAA